MRRMIVAVGLKSFRRTLHPGLHHRKYISGGPTDTGESKGFPGGCIVADVLPGGRDGAERTRLSSDAQASGFVPGDFVNVLPFTSGGPGMDCNATFAGRLRWC